MNVLTELVEALASKVHDVSPIPEIDVLHFADEHHIPMRTDHLRFLTRFSPASGTRSRLFQACEGDFDFWTVKRVYCEFWSEMIAPDGCAYFGSNFPGDSFCIEYETGGIFAYDEGKKYSLAYESLDGFLLRGLIAAYGDSAFSEKQVKKAVSVEVINEFRLANAARKIKGATSFEISYQIASAPNILSEYYFLDGKLIVIYPIEKIMVVLGGAIVQTVLPRPLSD